MSFLVNTLPLRELFWLCLLWLCWGLWFIYSSNFCELFVFYFPFFFQFLTIISLSILLKLVISPVIPEVCSIFGVQFTIGGFINEYMALNLLEWSTSIAYLWWSWWTIKVRSISIHLFNFFVPSHISNINLSNIKIFTYFATNIVFCQQENNWYISEL